jgi:signal transduction histidine kinase
VGKGTGLGLYVVHNIIERHGGQIKVSSSPGTGTIFSVLLPISGADSLTNGQTRLYKF